MPSSRRHDEDIRHAIAPHCEDIVVRQRTLIAHVDSPHDFAMLIDSLQCDRLLGMCRWININKREEHP